MSYGLKNGKLVLELNIEKEQDKHSKMRQDTKM